MRRVLLVDDDPDHSAVVRALLEEMGVEDVVVATTVAAAHKSMAARVPNIVVADYRMPDTDGLSFLAGVAEASPKARRVLLTGFDPSVLQRTPAAKYAHAVVQKSFDLESMQQALRNALAA